MSVSLPGIDCCPPPHRATRRKHSRRWARSSGAWKSKWASVLSGKLPPNTAGGGSFRSGVEGNGGPVVGRIVGSEQLAAEQARFFLGSEGPAAPRAAWRKPKH